jgi:Fe2+ transport system protein FeoA
MSIEPQHCADSVSGIRGSVAPLAALTPNALGRVIELAASADDAVRLKSLGICIGRRVQLVKTGDPLIVRVLGTRVGLSHRLALGVHVEQL